MKKLNYDRVLNVLNDYLYNYFELSAFVGTDFGYYYDTDEIEVSFFAPTENDKAFTKYFQELGLKYNADVFLLSLFHEIGHANTLDDIDEKEYNKVLKIKETLTDSAEDYEVYLRLTDERMATQWAVDYINENAEEVKALWNLLQVEILNFYKENGLTN